MTRDKRLVKEACSLFEADSTRQPYSPNHDRFVVSPETSRELLTAFIRQAKKQLLIYDVQVSDNLIHRVLLDRIRAGVEVRVIGKIEKISGGVECRKLLDLRLHVRAIVRDGNACFVGSQSLRKLELDGRREVGLIITDSRIAKKVQAVFEADWTQTAPASKSGKEKDKEKDALLLFPSPDDAGIDHRTGAGNRVEEELVAVDLRHQKCLIGVEPFRGEPGSRSILPFRSCPPEPVTQYTMSFWGLVRS